MRIWGALLVAPESREGAAGLEPSVGGWFAPADFRRPAPVSGGRLVPAGGTFQLVLTECCPLVLLLHSCSEKYLHRSWIHRRARTKTSWFLPRVVLWLSTLHFRDRPGSRKPLHRHSTMRIPKEIPSPLSSSVRPHLTIFQNHMRRHTVACPD